MTSATDATWAFAPVTEVASAIARGELASRELVALFLAPYLRKFGQFTIPDFLGARYGGNIVRTIGIARARVKIGIANLAYNMRRFVWLKAKYAATWF